jgi:hypothetical protein
LYLNSVLYGLGTGAWLATQTQAETAAGVILPALGIAGGAVAGVAVADSSRRFRYGVPQSIVSGMYIGLEEGIVWAFWNQARVDRAAEWEPETIASVIWVSASAGAAAGGIVGTVAGTTPGRASYVGSAALWTGVVTGLTVFAASPDDRQRDDRALLGGALGLNAGALAGVFTAGPVSPTIARVRFLDLGALGGALVFGGLFVSASSEVDTVNNDEERGLAAVTALGIASGLTVAWFLTDGMQPDRGARPHAGSGPAPLRLALAPAARGLGLSLAGLW